MRISRTAPFLFAIALAPFAHAQGDADQLAKYGAYDFKAGERTVFEDALTSDKPGGPPIDWTLEGGEAVVDGTNDDRCIDIKQYYTLLSPKGLPSLPDSFTVEYDTWLAAGYDGNPGIQLHFRNGDTEFVITPNKDQVSGAFPGGQEQGDTPPQFRGAQYYDRWIHIGLAYLHGSLLVYLDQFKVFTIADCQVRPTQLIVSGNSSQDMPMRFKNFRIAKVVASGALHALATGRFITHAIRFDVDRSTLRPESMSVLNEVAAYLKATPAAQFEIGGHTDSNGDDAANLALSQARAEAVRTQLVRMGISAAQLTSKGYGEMMPMEPNTTSEGKAHNRRVEFTKR